MKMPGRMTRRRTNPHHLALLWTLGFFLFSPWASAQKLIGTEPEDRPRPEPATTFTGLAGVPFGFTPSSARALGMGGAFLGVADDPSTAEANPAGLAALGGPAAAVSFAGARYDVEIEDPNAYHTLDLVNTFGSGNAAARTRFESDDEVSYVSFAGYSQPVGPFAFAVYYQQPFNFEGSSTFSFQDGPFQDFFDSKQDYDFTLENIGTSASVKLGPVALGVAIQYSRLDVELLRRLEVGFYQDLEFLTFNFDHDDFIQYFDRLNSSDGVFTFNAGLLFNPGGVFSAGLVFKEGAEYEIDGVFTVRDCIDFKFEDFPTGDGGTRELELTCEPSSFGQTLIGDNIREDDTPFSQTFTIPDVYGGGIAWRPGKQWLIAVDVVRINYSDLTLSGAQIAALPAGLGANIEQVDDATEVRAGVQYTFTLGDTPFMVRGGYYSDQDHDGLATFDSDQDHLTAGLGVVLEDIFEIDVAGDFADNVQQGMLSLIVRF